MAEGAGSGVAEAGEGAGVAGEAEERESGFIPV